MSVDEYLVKLSNQLRASETELGKIETSFDYLVGKLHEHFRDRIEKVQLFGSHGRKTKLPSSVDFDSDVDVMVIFKTNEYQPQTFLKHLQIFGDTIYPRSSVEAEHPAVCITLDHVKFDLVPAYWEEYTFSVNELKIPAPRNKELKWITTEPEEISSQLFEKNKEENQMIIPLIKLIKYFNFLSGRPYDSFWIERFAISRSYPNKKFKDYFFEFINDLDYDDTNTKQKVDFIKELKNRREKLLLLDKNGMDDYAILELQKFLPLIESSKLQVPVPPAIQTPH